MESLLIVGTLVKLLLIPAYRSTDFEVHRNWLAITHSLPISQWYTEHTSEWTLDYPPLFAWFEKLLSMFAILADPAMLVVENLNYASPQTIFFQRATVIVSELILYWALKRYVKYFGSKYVHWILAGALFLHPGILIVDHMHFQYNGFLYGILVLSIVEAKRNNLLESGILFAILLNFKHIYLYMAPAYFVYLLQAYCFVPVESNREGPNGQRKFSVGRLITLGSAVVGVFTISMGPFIYMGQLPNLVGRLFPFTRGLCHAYWAPNFWALYAALDRILIFAAKALGWPLNEAALGSMTRGYVGDTQFAVLPPVQAIHTMLITVIVQLIVLQVLWRKPTFDNFLSSLTLCTFASYLFGWHVHEKAIMLVLVPLGLMAANSKTHLRIFIILSSTGIFSLFPLLFEPTETPIKVSVTLLWLITVVPGLARCLARPLKSILTYAEMYYIIGIIGVQIYTDIGHNLIFGSKTLQFLPLMLTSVYCAVGIIYGWGLFMREFLAGRM
ncbi:glycosyltransferase family 57 protein [Phycomyces blakesleeanus]|uniref:Alpha-1,3-glucosyltransferase n=2 Tax=Phycomyces blakesleeanus TaxID=4837 RepID=A0A162TQD4_PHYB8|nr:glycosyltransferase family 57 protein [Phycomyces blakesleeanus NRRL 1555(-)]OAD70232.1 glycosyltransferase family 57 protein [Phycomyces blakesleeanus NRRL 1555(-)]|eukprot:XP_018288272.1 glycosyltransferase family 57 protein [Phycomyces blakesleeanus NRRL 1555(-)]